MLRRLVTALQQSASEASCTPARARSLISAQSCRVAGVSKAPTPSTCSGAALPGQHRTFNSPPEFTASNGGPKFTAGPGRGAAADVAADTSFACSSTEESAYWEGGFEDALTQVQEAALSHVKELGWSNEALVAGARNVGVSPAIAGSLQKGGADLVQFFVRRCQAELAERMAEEHTSLEELPLQQRLHTLLRWRLEMLKPYIDSWPQALAQLAAPNAAASSLGLLNDLADEVWHAAGDRSTDYSWYTKRAGLAGIYSATELYMLTDYSAEYADTWSYLDRRISEMLSLGISV